MNQLGLDVEIRQPNITQSSSTLAMCPDCSRAVSYRAEHCPSCGLRLQPRENQQTSIGRIAVGVILGYLGIMVINAVLFFVVMIFFAGVMARALDGVRSAPTTETPKSR